MPQRTKLTPELIEKFLELLANNGGIVSDAAEDLNISRTALYRERDKNPAIGGDGPHAGKKLRDAWDKAVDLGIDVLEDEAKRRALDGTEEPIFYQGDEVGHVWKKSDRCMELMLKGHRNKYREKHEITGPEGKPLMQPVVVYLPDNKRQRGTKPKRKTKRKKR